jgi:hypothetical protein
VSSKTQDIKILSYSYYIDNAGYLDVIGEIQNTGTDTIEKVVLTVTIYGADGTTKGTLSDYAWVSYMAPQQKAPFLIDLASAEDGLDWYTTGVSKVEVSVREADATSSHLYSDFEISVKSAVVSTSGDDKGTYWVSGSVKNVGSQTASKLAVAATFYNSSGDVVAVGHTDYLTPTNVSPSENAAFKVGAYDTNQTGESASKKITSYALYVQAESPLIEGNAPAATAQATGSSSTDLQNDTDSLSNQNLIYVLIIVGVAVAVIAALLVSRKGKPAEPEVDLKKPVNKKKRMLENIQPFPFFN